MKSFDLTVGVDYSGAAHPEARLPGLQMYAAAPGHEPERTPPPTGRHWARRGLAAYLHELVSGDRRVLIGVDHGFSFPIAYFQRLGLRSWPEFLEDFSRHWPTADAGVTVRDVRDGRAKGSAGGLAGRTGRNSEFRLCEQWTSSAKSVFQFDVQGSVATSTHAGLPWLQWLRQACGERLFWWPFDGWVPPEDVSLIAEVYPSLSRRRYPRAGRTADEQDAYAVARWLQDMEARGALDRFWEPPLTGEERAVANCEGWILGVV
jgi:hypothetical protein